MRITTNTNDTTTTTTDDASPKAAYITKQKSKLSRVASSLGANNKSYQLASRLERWAEVDPAQAEAHSAALATLLEAVAAVRGVVSHLDSLPVDYNPSAPKTKRGGKFEVGAPVAIKEAKVEEYDGLIEDPKCLKVVEVRKTVILIETTDGVRFPIAKAALEVIA